ncbi:MAG: hypothetical protein ACR2RB_06720 [Gammaproteobacteria bacterium]
MGKYTEQLRRAEQQHRRMQERIEQRCRKSGHAWPTTRREFLGHGLIAGTATMLVPSIATLMSRAAKAQVAECPLGGVGGLLGAGKIPFIAIDQGGGASMVGDNVVVGKAGGQEDFLNPAGFRKQGLPAAIQPPVRGVNRDFGFAMHPDSALLNGMLAQTSLATRMNTNGSVIPARSENDTGNNPHNMCGGIARAGAAGEFAVRVGTRGGDTGGRSDEPASMGGFPNTRIEDAAGAIGLLGGGEVGFPGGPVATAAQAIAQLKLDKLNEEAKVEALLKCGVDQHTAKFASAIQAATLDPNQDVNIAAAFANVDIVNDDDFAKAAAVAKVVIGGFGGCGTIEYGGRDYHRDPRPETEGKDFVVGQVIGASLEYAALTQRPLMIVCFSDGSVNADVDEPENAGPAGNNVIKFRHRSDNSEVAASFMLAYSPNGRPVPRVNQTVSEQIGFFTANGNVDTNSTPFANNPTVLAEMCVANYMALHGEEANFNAVLPGNSLGDPSAFLAWASIV